MMERRKLLFEKLNLKGPKTWSPKGAAAARELLAEYNDTFSLEPSRLGCIAAVKHKIKVTDDAPFKREVQKDPTTSGRRGVGQPQENAGVWCNTP